MKLVKIECDNCKAQLEVDKNTKFVKCKYCGSTVYLDDETINVNHLKKGEITEEQEFINAETRLNNFKAYDEAYKDYTSLSKRYVDNEEIWIGLLRCLTHDFSYKNRKDPNFKNECIKYWNRYSSLVDEKINPYIDTYIKYMGIKKIDKVSDLNNENIYDKNYVLVTFFLGIFGVHKFLQKKYVLGLLYLFTYGLFGIGWIIDIYKECKKWKGSNQNKILISLIRYILSFQIFIIFISYISNKLYLSALLLIIVFFITLPYTSNYIKTINYKQKIIISCLLLIIPFCINQSNSEKKFEGKWVHEDSYFEFKDSSNVKFKLNNKIYNGYFSSYMKEGTLTDKKDSNKTFNFKLINNEKDLCYYKNNDNKCIFILKK